MKVHVHLLSLILYFLKLCNVLSRCAWPFFSPPPNWKSDLGAESATLAPSPTVPLGSMVLGVMVEPVPAEIRVKGLGCSPRTMKLTTSKAALCHTSLDQGCFNCHAGTSQILDHCLSWSMPKPWVQQVPCFLELISLDSTTVSLSPTPDSVPRTSHYDFPSARKATSLTQIPLPSTPDAPDIPIRDVSV